MANDVKKMRKDDYNCEECVIVPPADIYETVDEYVIRADMPGTRRENLDITLEKNQLDIYGRLDEELTSEENLKYGEYRLYNYHRTFVVGDGIDREKINATLENGVLTLTLPKSEKLKPRKIEIKVEA
ncbi:MAG: Hsp20/alpha crystallin family protein [Spirochaetales bacterium]|nr:MAG: Hsp20/alpha crystallin family protein [Spirochaetales bacterium]